MSPKMTPINYRTGLKPHYFELRCLFRPPRPFEEHYGLSLFVPLFSLIVQPAF